MAEFKTYRDRNTDIVREYPVSLARVFSNLEEVDVDAPCYTCGEGEGEPLDDGADSTSEWDEDAPDEEDEA